METNSIQVPKIKKVLDEIVKITSSYGWLIDTKQIQLFSEKHGTTRTIAGILINLGYLEKTKDRGVLKQIKKFDNDTALKIMKINSSTSMAVYLKNKTALMKLKYGLKNLQLNNIENNPRLELTEDICISFLKSKGYKIMKPIQQFEEI